jgi:hypothetical protein
MERCVLDATLMGWFSRIHYQVHDDAASMSKVEKPPPSVIVGHVESHVTSIIEGEREVFEGHTRLEVTDVDDARPLDRCTQIHHEFDGHSRLLVQTRLNLGTHDLGRGSCLAARHGPLKPAAPHYVLCYRQFGR